MRTQGHNAAKSKWENNRGKVGRDDPRPVDLPFLFSPRRSSFSGKPLIHLQVHALESIVQRPYEPLRKIHASLPSLKIPENSLQLLPLHILSLCILYQQETPGRVVCEFVQRGAMKKAMNIVLRRRTQSSLSEVLSNSS
jgi:hypothetical protein